MSTEKLPDLSNLRVFGCPAYLHIDVSRRRKFGDKAWKGVFVGYAPDSPAWLVYNPVTRNVIRNRNVVFNERWLDTGSSPPPPQKDIDENFDDGDEDEPNHD